MYTKFTRRSYTKLKEVDDVLGGAAAWENVDSCDEKVDIFWHSDEKFCIY